jgi:hypothetical protein
MKHVTLTLDDKIFNWINRERGNINRSKFINAILNEKYKKFKETFDWEEAERIADKEIAAGKTHKFKTATEAIEWLNN